MKRVPPDLTRNARTLRNNATPAERKLWRILSHYRPRFTRQLVIGRYIADIAHRQAKLVVELDGSQHVDSASDGRRTANLEGEGWRVIRFWNGEVLENVEGVAETIVVSTEERLEVTLETAAPRKRKPRGDRPSDK